MATRPNAEKTPRGKPTSDGLEGAGLGWRDLSFGGPKFCEGISSRLRKVRGTPNAPAGEMRCATLWTQGQGRTLAAQTPRGTASVYGLPHARHTLAWTTPLATAKRPQNDLLEPCANSASAREGGPRSHPWGLQIFPPAGEAMTAARLSRKAGVDFLLRTTSASKMHDTSQIRRVRGTGCETDRNRSQWAVDTAPSEGLLRHVTK